MMKIKHLLLIGLACVAGCKTTTFTQTTASGMTVTFKDTRFFMSTAANMEATIGTNGIQTIKGGITSAGDAAMTEALAKGVAAGVVEGMKAGK